MRILFTGGSSFTGYWFIKELAAAGHQVTATFRREPNQYTEEIRRRRVDALNTMCDRAFGVSFGDAVFVGLIKQQSWDIFCHHGAEVADYKSPSFDISAAVANTTFQLPIVLDALLNSGCSKIVMTGSVFENDEGAGSDGLRAFSPYGISKALTWQVFRYYAQVRKLTLGKFVISNPFGPYEEPRFVNYLMKSWFAGEPAAVNTPGYVRDNIHVSLLAKAYVHYVTFLAEGITRINPSGYVESQGTFSKRVADEMRNRLRLNCAVEFKSQIDYSEPRTRINTDPCDSKTLNWNEVAAWDDLADYYARLFAKH